LTAATALAERGVDVTIVGEHRPGEASPASAGMLAPSIERAPGPAHQFGIAARDRYPSYIEFLAERTGVKVPLNRLGILQVALTEKGIKGLRKSAVSTSRWLDPKELQHFEPALPHALGAMFNAQDGAVDNAALLNALDKLCAASKWIVRIDGAVKSLKPRDDSCEVELDSGSRLSARRVVIAAGAWAGKISGARFARAVKPARGQLVSYSNAPLRHVAYGPSGYLVPRGGTTICGSTMEDVGFDAETTPAGVKKVKAAAEEICPQLASSETTKAWAGLRPATPDLLPIIGSDPEHPSLLYACGHSRNGVLLAPLTGDLIADLVTESPLNHDLSQFRPDRF
jgi:glycine/D-amino acid oxidase-like deaminating enzyme